MRLVGIIGGMGPQATVFLMQRILDLTPACGDADHVPLLVCSDPRIPDRTAALRGAGPSPLPALIGAGKRLEAAGAELLAVSCNTAHAYLPDLRQALDLPFIDMVDEVAADVSGRLPPGAAVGVLATDGTLEAGIYRDALAARGLRALEPLPEDQRRVMAVIYGAAGVKAGCVTQEQADILASVIGALHRRGARAAVAGCTEIPVVLDAFKPDTEVPVISSTDVLARAIIREAQSRA